MCEPSAEPSAEPSLFELCRGEAINRINFQFIKIYEYDIEKDYFCCKITLKMSRMGRMSLKRDASTLH